MSSPLWSVPRFHEAALAMPALCKAAAIRDCWDIDDAPTDCSGVRRMTSASAFITSSSEIRLEMVTTLAAGSAGCGVTIVLASGTRGSRRNPRINRYIPNSVPRAATVVTRSGRQRNDGRWKVKAASGHGGRGYSDAWDEDRRRGREDQQKNGKPSLRR